MSPIDNCKEIPVREVHDIRGNIGFCESMNDIPFEIKRIYYLNKLPKGAVRGSHAHKTLEQFFIMLNGSCNLHLKDGTIEKSYFLDDSSKGIYLPSMIWRELSGFSNDAICLVLASDLYYEDDYIRTYEEFLNLIK